MRVGFELTALELDEIGTGRSVSLLRRELERAPAVELVDLRHTPAPRPRLAGRLARGLDRELRWLPWTLPRRAAALGLDLLHCPSGLAPVRSGVPVVLTVHDVMALERPEWFTRTNVLQQRLVLARAARAAAAVLTPSAFSRIRAIDRLGLDPARVHVAPWGVEERFSPAPRADVVLERLGVGGRYLLSVGTLQPRKNLEAALSAFERIADRHPVELVVAGARGWRDEALVERICASPAAHRVRLTGRVSDEELLALYRGAECFVFPSLYEGFGFPALEAMSCGTPLVSSDRTSLPEVVGEGGLLVEPEDPAAIASAVDSVLSSSELRRELTERGLARAATFTWARCAEDTLAAYRAALARRSASAARQ